MDIAIVSINKKTNEFEFAGARNPVLIIREDEIFKLEGNRFSIDSIKNSYEIHFKNHSFQLKKNDIIYLFSDGYKDQMGGNEHKKFYSTSFNSLLLSISNYNMDKQESILKKVLEDWMGKGSQTDDILIFGIRV